jgi:flagellar secretion chaperone FliS
MTPDDGYDGMRGFAEDVYRETHLEAVGKARLVQMLLSRALDHARKVREFCVGKRIEDRHNENMRLVEIVLVLRRYLNMDSGGDVARNLDQIYAHVLHACTRVDVTNDVSLIDHVIGILETFEKAWATLAGSTKAPLVPTAQSAPRRDTAAPAQAASFSLKI